MGMAKGWVPPSIPIGQYGFDDYAVCFWGGHADSVGWLIRVVGGAVGFGLGYYLGKVLGGARVSDVVSVLTLDSAWTLPLVTFAKTSPEVVVGLVGMVVGFIAAHFALNTAACSCPPGESGFCLCWMCYLVPWSPIPIPLFPHPCPVGACVTYVPPSCI